MGKVQRVHPRRLISLLLVWLLCMSFVQPAFAANETARTVQMSKKEGTVTVTNSGGRKLSVRDDMRLYNGNQVETDEASYVWLTLDSSKLAKLDEVSELELRKSGKKLELLVNSGNLFFNVTEPLEQEETLNIRTSTMVVGIRGTCGWVKVLDQGRSRLYVLEGRVTCMVTDPVTGQVKSTVLTGGDWADFVVYDQDRAGDKCDIIRQRYTEEDVPGFVLVELAGNRGLCEKIYSDSGLDLRNVTQAQAQAQLRKDQAEMAAELAGDRQALSEQERNVSTDPVWENNSPSNNQDSDSDSDSGSSGSSGGGVSAPVDTSGVTNTTPTTTQALTMTMPVTIPQIQAALNRANVSAVTVVPGTGNNTLTQLGTETLTVDADKTLTLNSGIDMVVQNPGVVNVNGTMNVNGNLDNYGTITVTSPNSLHVSGYFRNHNTGNVNNTDSGHIVPAQGIENSGTITTSGNAILESGAGATVTMEAASAELNLNGGSISNNGGGNAILWTASGGSPAEDITNTDTTNIWTTGSAPLAVMNADNSKTENPALNGYKVVTNSGQTSLRPTGGVEGGVLVYTVTFDANGGRWSGNAPVITVEQNMAMGAVSSSPTRDGYTFVDWRDVSGAAYTASTTINRNVTLYAQWKAVGGTPVDPEPETVTVTFKDGAAIVAAITIEKGGSLPYLPAAPTAPAGMVFDGWEGTLAAYSADTTVTAKWAEAPPEPGTPETVTVTFKDGAVTIAAITIEKGGSLPYLPAAPTAPEGMVFDGWENTQNTYSVSTTVTAKWTAAPKPDTVTVTFRVDFPDDVYGEEEETVTILKGQSLNYPPISPEADGYKFLYWKTEDDKIFDSWTDPLTSDLTLYGVWEADTTPGEDKIPDRFTTSEASDQPEQVARALEIYDAVYVYAIEDDNDFDLNRDLTIPDGKTLMLVGSGDTPAPVESVGDTWLNVLGGATLTVKGNLIIYGESRVDKDGAMLVEPRGAVGCIRMSVDGTCTNYGGIVGDILVVDGVLCSNGGIIYGELTVGDENSASSPTVTLVGGEVNMGEYGYLTMCSGSLYVSNTQISGTYFQIGGTAHLSFLEGKFMDTIYMREIIQLGGELVVEGGDFENVTVGEGMEGYALSASGARLRDANYIHTGDIIGGVIENLSVYPGGNVTLGNGLNVIRAEVNGGSLTIYGAEIGEQPSPVSTTSGSAPSLAPGLYVYGGEVDLKSGVVNDGIHQTSAWESYTSEVHMTGGTVHDGYTIDGGTLLFYDGHIDSISQAGGTVEIWGGTVNHGYAISGGKLSVSGGIIEAYYYDPAIEMSGGTVTIQGDAIIRSSESERVIHYLGGKLNLTGGLIWNEWAAYGWDSAYAVAIADNSNPDITIEDGAVFFVGTEGDYYYNRTLASTGDMLEYLQNNNYVSPNAIITAAYYNHYSPSSSSTLEVYLDVEYVYPDERGTVQRDVQRVSVDFTPVLPSGMDIEDIHIDEVYRNRHDEKIYISYHYDGRPMICSSYSDSGATRYFDYTGFLGDDFYIDPKTLWYVRQKTAA